jgi:hypothetical protein
VWRGRPRDRIFLRHGWSFNPESMQHVTVTDERGGEAAAWWAVAGVTLLFANAVWRLGARGVITMAAGLRPLEWLALLGLTAVFVYGEGVRALQMKYLPRLLQRVAEVRAERRVLPRVLAPLHALMLVYAPAGTLLRAWAGILAITAAVLIVRAFPEPWRGIVDFAVAAALAWATVALLIGAHRLLVRR